MPEAVDLAAGAACRLLALAPRRASAVSLLLCPATLKPGATVQYMKGGTVLVKHQEGKPCFVSHKPQTKKMCRDMAVEWRLL